MPLSDAEYRVLAAFRRSLRQFLAFTERVATGVGITQQQYQALLVVRAHEGPGLLSISDLAEQMLIRHHSAVGMVDRLEALGLVRRAHAPSDRRKVGVALTLRGRRLFHRMADVQRAELRRIGPDMARFMEHFAAGPGGGRRRS